LLGGRGFLAHLSGSFRGIDAKQASRGAERRAPQAMGVSAFTFNKDGPDFERA
jgi:hypothetical protein